MRAIYLTVESI